MAYVDPSIVEMPVDPASGAMPHYRHVLEWAQAETAALTAAQLDFDDASPDKEWMWWSCRRQVSHMAWDALVFPWRRCSELLWPGGDIPNPIDWDRHHLGPNAAYDRVLDESLFWELPDLFAKLELGISWLERVVVEQRIEQLRSDVTSVRSTHFWKYVIQTLPRGAGPDAERPGHLRFDLEGSLWMVFYEMLSHVRTIQRLKAVQGVPTVVDLPRIGYLRLPEYWGEVDVNGPSMERLSA